MKKLAGMGTVLVTALLLAPAAFAQGAEAATGEKGHLYIAAAFGMALAAFGGALGQSKVASSACEGMARNPGAAGAIQTAMILGLVFIETLALFTLAVVFVKVK
jgi:F-type H+-transporting ATPase subunit c